MFDKSNNPKEEDIELSKTRINLLSADSNTGPRSAKIWGVGKFVLYLTVICFIAFLVFSYQVLLTGSSITEMFNGKLNIFKQLNTWAGESGKLQGEVDDRVNIILSGMGGPGHDGPYLTDTIIIASIQPSTKRISFISVPRDLLVEIPGYGWWKINNANALGEQKSEGQGGALLKEVIQRTFDMPIHYYVRVDFSGFEKIIDDLQGVRVYVDRSFIDYQFPADDYKYQVVSFEQGWHTMDGKEALEFARSRHGNNGEGSDFARSKRQQKILQAAKEKIFSYNFLLNPAKISSLTKELANHLTTDLEPWEVIKLATLLEKCDTENILSGVLDDSPGGYLYANVVNSAYVLEPRGGDFSEIQAMAKNIFNEQTKITEKKIVNLEIRNGTVIPGLASRNAEEVKLLGYRVLNLSNAPEQTYQETVIYKLSKHDLPEETKFLADKYATTITAESIPDWINETAAPDIDFIIILGKNADE
ncbi:LCP family protein [Patescibacteria group bacterium]|nr:LCP family protein [Patescibacteria group bacterium]